MTRMAFSRESADIRRAALIAATRDCLAEGGVAGASVRAVCARAGVSPGLLRHYFDGIDALVAETYLSTCAELSGWLEAAVSEAGPDPRARLAAYVTASFRPPIAAPRLLATWLAFWALVRTDPRIAAIHGETYAAFRARLAGLLIECGIAPSAAANHAIALTALIDGLWLELTLDADALDAERASVLAEHWLNLLLETGA